MHPAQELSLDTHLHAAWDAQEGPCGSHRQGACGLHSAHHVQQGLVRLGQGALGPVQAEAARAVGDETVHPAGEAQVSFLIMQRWPDMCGPELVYAAWADWTDRMLGSDAEQRCTYLLWYWLGSAGLTAGAPACPHTGMFEAVQATPHIASRLPCS